MQSGGKDLQKKFDLKLDVHDIGELGYEESDPSEPEKKKSSSDSSDDYGKDVVSRFHLPTVKLPSQIFVCNLKEIFIPVD